MKKLNFNFALVLGLSFLYAGCSAKIVNNYESEEIYLPLKATILKEGDNLWLKLFFTNTSEYDLTLPENFFDRNAYMVHEIFEGRRYLIPDKRLNVYHKPGYKPKITYKNFESQAKILTKLNVNDIYDLNVGSLYSLEYSNVDWESNDMFSVHYNAAALCFLLGEDSVEAIACPVEALENDLEWERSGK